MSYLVKMESFCDFLVTPDFCEIVPHFPYSLIHSPVVGFHKGNIYKERKMHIKTESISIGQKQYVWRLVAYRFLAINLAI